MPLYDYQCKACQKVSEVRHGFREDFTGPCPACGAPEMARVFNAAPIIFNGSGFYINDSRPAKQADGAKADTASTPKPADSPKKSESSAA